MKSSDTLEPLSFLIGKWHTSGRLLTGKPGVSSVIRGMDSYEWIAGGKFILHTVDVMMGDDRVQAVEIIGVKGKKFMMTSYDDHGSITTMTAALARGVLKLGDDTMRASLTRNADGSMRAYWESFDRSWKPWMEIELRQ